MFTFHFGVMTRIANVIELVGSSDNGWPDAAQAALAEAERQYIR